jgi:hypothetical protein
MTGRAAGYCAGYPVPGFSRAVYGGGHGRGGRGWRNQYFATGLTGWQRGGYAYTGGAAPGYLPNYPAHAAGYSRENELNVLKGQAEYLEDSLAGINQRIKELEEKGRN